MGTAIVLPWCAQGNPMAFLVEKGGGRAIWGGPGGRSGAVLELQPRAIHERSAIFLGSAQDVDRIEALYAEAA